MSDLPEIINVLEQGIRINEMEMKLQDMRVELALAKGRVFLTAYDEGERGYAEIEQLVEMLEIVQKENTVMKEEMKEYGIG